MEQLDILGLEEAFGAGDITSGPMRRAIEQWFRLYYCPQETRGCDYSLQLPYTVVRKLTRAVFSEYSAEGHSALAQNVLRGLDACRDKAVELALIGGESYLKPVFDGKNWHFQPIDRRGVLIFGRDSFGNITDMGTAERSVSGRLHYTLLERRWVENGYLTLENRLYRSAVPGVLGSRVSLKAHGLYAGLPERFTYPQKVGSVGIVALKNPAANCIDGSPDGVSVYAPAVGLIQRLARNESQLDGEFERGKSRIVVSRDMLRGDQLRDEVFVGLDEDPGKLGITVFAPELREEAYRNRKQSLLRDVENAVGLKRGLLSQVDEVQRTATEITSSQGEYMLTVMDFQRMWEQAAVEAVALCAALGRMYGSDGESGEVSFRWGNGVLFDAAP